MTVDKLGRLEVTSEEQVYAAPNSMSALVSGAYVPNTLRSGLGRIPCRPTTLHVDSFFPGLELDVWIAQ